MPVGQQVSLASESQRALFSSKALSVNLTLGTFAWMVEVTIYFVSLYAVGVTVDFPLFFLALAVFPLASLGGSLSFLPGGLGITEGGIVALGILLGGFLMRPLFSRRFLPVWRFSVSWCLRD